SPPGATACFEGPLESQHSCSVQLAQTSHFALQTPYMVFGLGDTLNVVNNLRVSVANGPCKDRFRRWDENIPGSNLVVVPYQPNQPPQWDLRVYINMSIYSLVSLSFLLTLGAIL